MRILFLANAASIHTNKWIDYFISKGHNITCITLSPLEDSAIKGCNYIVVTGAMKAIRVIKGLALANRTISEGNYDVVHAHYAGVYGLIAALSRSNKFIITVWGSDVLLSAKTRLRRQIIKYILNKASLITYDGKNMQMALLKLGVQEKAIEQIRFGVDTDLFKFKENGGIQRSEWGCENEDFVVISTRSFEIVYDVETLIFAMKMVVGHVNNIKLILVGGGSQRNHLEKLVGQLSLRRNVKFVGKYENFNLPRILSSANLYISTSLSDSGLAVSTGEAMACELPVIITDIGENRDWIDEGVTGYLVQPKSPEELAYKIMLCYEKRELATSMGKRGRMVILDRNDYKREMCKMERIYYDHLSE